MTKFDISKVNNQYTRLELNSLSAYEIQALGKLLIGLSESMINKETMDAALTNYMTAGTSGFEGGLN